MPILIHQHSPCPPSLPTHPQTHSGSPAFASLLASLRRAFNPPPHSPPPHACVPVCPCACVCVSGDGPDSEPEGCCPGPQPHCCKPRGAARPMERGEGHHGVCVVCAWDAAAQWDTKQGTLQKRLMQIQATTLLLHIHPKILPYMRLPTHTRTHACA